MRTFTKLMIVFCALCGGAAFAADASSIMLTDGHARAMPPTVRNSSAYFTLHNHGSGDVVVTGGHSEVAASVQVHETYDNDGQLAMRELDRLTIPAGGMVRFESGGLHMMLIGLKAPLIPGHAIELTLEFADGSVLPLSLPVETPRAGVSMQQGMDHGNH